MSDAVEVAAHQYACWRQDIDPDDQEVERHLLGPYEASRNNARLFMPLAFDALAANGYVLVERALIERMRGVIAEVVSEAHVPDEDRSWEYRDLRAVLVATEAL